MCDGHNACKMMREVLLTDQHWKGAEVLRHTGARDKSCGTPGRRAHGIQTRWEEVSGNFIHTWTTHWKWTFMLSGNLKAWKRMRITFASYLYILAQFFHLEVGVGQHVSSRVKVLDFLKRAHDLFSNLKHLVFFKIWWYIFLDIWLIGWWGVKAVTNYVNCHGTSDGENISRWHCVT